MFIIDFISGQGFFLRPLIDTSDGESNALRPGHVPLTNLVIAAALTETLTAIEDYPAHHSGFHLQKHEEHRWPVERQRLWLPA